MTQINKEESPRCLCRVLEFEALDLATAFKLGCPARSISSHYEAFAESQNIKVTSMECHYLPNHASSLCNHYQSQTESHPSSQMAWS